jgi:hypothetical protein
MFEARIKLIANKAFSMTYLAINERFLFWTLRVIIPVASCLTSRSEIAEPGGSIRDGGPND